MNAFHISHDFEGCSKIYEHLGLSIFLFNSQHA